MPLFRVMCYREGAWDRQEPRVIDAQTAMDAAEKVSRERLVRGLVERSPVYFKVWPHIRYAEWTVFQRQAFLSTSVRGMNPGRLRSSPRLVGGAEPRS